MMMIKSKFGDAVRSKTETAMRNEVYGKLICHNLYCLIMAMHRLDIGAGFMAGELPEGSRRLIHRDQSTPRSGRGA